MFKDKFYDNNRMGFKSIERKREYNKLRLKNKREALRSVSLDVVPDVVPFIHDIMRFELFFDTLRMRELLSRKTNFNLWMNKQLDVLDELKEYEKIM